MLRAYKGYVLVERKKIAETQSGIIVTSNPANTLVVKATLVDKMNDQLDGMKIGDVVYVNKTKALDIEGYDEHFFVPEEAVVGRG